ncbi:MAG TPA: hypothetical protein VM598_00625, partial [Bdellovibrionota bacterium]|nr:hypothetical protein [Bdellovibrionota bacterium]
MENTRHARNLVLISKHPEDAPFCAAVCETAGLSLEHFETVDQAFASDSSGNRVALVVDVGAESDHRRLKTALSSLANAGKTLNPEAIYYVTDLPIDQAAFLIVGSSACNYVLRNFKDPIEAGRLYGRLLSNTLNGTSLELATLLSGGAAIET